MTGMGWREWTPPLDSIAGFEGKSCFDARFSTFLLGKAWRLMSTGKVDGKTEKREMFATDLLIDSVEVNVRKSKSLKTKHSPKKCLKREKTKNMINNNELKWTAAMFFFPQFSRYSKLEWLVLSFAITRDKRKTNSLKRATVVMRKGDLLELS